MDQYLLSSPHFLGPNIHSKSTFENERLATNPTDEQIYHINDTNFKSHSKLEKSHELSHVFSNKTMGEIPNEDNLKSCLPKTLTSRFNTSKNAARARSAMQRREFRNDLMSEKLRDNQETLERQIQLN